MARPRDPAAREAQRRVILEASGRLFAERGFHQTGIAAICEAVGMSPGGLYRYFASKQDIIRAIVAEERSGAIELVEAAESNDDLREGLVQMLMACASLPFDGVALSLEVTAEGTRDPVVGALVGEAYRAFTARIEGVLATGQERGAVAASVDLRAAAVALAALASGLSDSTAIGADPADPALAVALDRMVRGLLAGS